MSVQYIRPSVRPQKSFFDFNEIRHVGRGRWLVHYGMQYNPIQGQGQGHEPFKVGNPTIFKSYKLLTFRPFNQEPARTYFFNH